MHTDTHTHTSPRSKHVSLPLDFNCQLKKRNMRRWVRAAESNKEKRGKERKKGRKQVTGTDKRTNALLGSVQSNRAMGTTGNNILTEEK